MASRIGYIAFHSSFQPFSPEYRLWQAGKPFLCGYHFFDDPLVARKNKALADANDGLVNPDIDLMPEFRSVRRYEVPAPPVGGYLHGSWCLFNKEEPEIIIRCLGAILAKDPDFHLLVVVREGYDNFRAVVAWLQKNARKRHYSVFHRAGPRLLPIEGDDRATLADDLWLWRNCDRRVIGKAAITQKPAYAEWLEALQAEGPEPAQEFFNPHDSLANVMTMVGWAQESLDKA